MELAFETERLVLKILDKTYAELIFNFYYKNKGFLKEWEPIKNEEFYTIEFQEKLLENKYLNFMYGNLLEFWIFKKNCNDKVIGSVTFNNIVGGNFLNCHIAYNMDNDEINKGYITEAAEKAIDIIFQGYKLHRIEANIMPNNNASLKVVEKLGFVKEGLAKNYLEINGAWRDHFCLALLNDND